MKTLASQIVPVAPAATVAGLCVALAPSLGGTLQARAELAPAVVCEIDGVPKTVITARVVALDTALIANRLGAQVPGGMIYALAGDVEPTDGADPADWDSWKAGEVQLRDYKRARPIVLRVNKDQCLQIKFKNLLAPPDQVLSLLDASLTAALTLLKDSGTTETRTAGVFAQGLNWASPVPGAPPDKGQDDGSWVGQNTNSLAAPDEEKTYLLYAAEEGPFLLYSTGDNYTFGQAKNVKRDPNSRPEVNGGFGDGGQLTQGLFGAVMVQPELAEYYRSQVNREDLCLASTDGQWDGTGCDRANPAQLPRIDYQAVYPAGHPRAGRTILNMVQHGELVHSDLTAIIAGPSDRYGQPGRFPAAAADQPVFHDVAQTPNRREPYREFTIIYHECCAASGLRGALQRRSARAAAGVRGRQLRHQLRHGRHRLRDPGQPARRSDPTSECTECKYEEFFLSSWPTAIRRWSWTTRRIPAVRSPTPNDFTTYSCPESPTAATQAYYPDDPSNVYHSYLRDHTKFRILHGGSDLHHVHHQHAHQWLHSPNSSNSDYLDSQAIGPGSAFTLEMVYNGGGNKNLTVGDSIFHCHFYPHFAAGMWSLWRVHDVFETGTELTAVPARASRRKAPAPCRTARSPTGTPIPAIVPLPTKPWRRMPAPVRLADGRHRGRGLPGRSDQPDELHLDPRPAAGGVGKYENPGYPFFIPGIAGSRPPHPPLDFALACSVSGKACATTGAACAGGGRRVRTSGRRPAAAHRRARQADAVRRRAQPARLQQGGGAASGIGLPEEGTLVEQVAMKFHAQRNHPSVTPQRAHR